MEPTGGSHDRNRARPFHRAAILKTARLASARRPAEEGWVRIGFDGKREFCNPAGFIQGGILTAMLDDTMGPAVFVMTEGKLYTATITMTVNFLAPAKPGPIVGEADVTQLGKTVAFVAGKADGCRRHRARHRDDERAAGRDGEGDSRERFDLAAARA